MSDLTKRIRAAALIARAWTERIQKEHAHVFDKEDLSGLCAVASRRLAAELRWADLDPVFNVALDGDDEPGHVFVTVGDLIVDVTATQFGLAKICVRSTKARGLPWFWRRAHSRFFDAKQLFRHLEKRGWPVLQGAVGK